MKLYLVFKISVVSVVSNGIIFHVVLNISVVSVVSNNYFMLVILVREFSDGSGIRVVFNMR